ncbi:MAG TPA: FGGY family carbohydrate kinase [Actinomycetaceae bacterium]|nr:FGGY family carbohydrate kinase [Actinomycetaceae bacterium]
MAASFSVDLSKAQHPLVLSIDIGSTGTRGGVFDATGRPVTKTRVRVDHAFRTNAKGKSEISPDLILSGVISVIDGVVERLPHDSIAGVCMDTFASSLVGVEGGAAITPCYTHEDTRSTGDIPALRGYVAEGRLQQRTGTRLHTSYVPARLRWLARTQSTAFDAVDQWMSIGEYIYLRLLNVRGAATSTAAWSGMLNRHDATWDAELVASLGLRPGQLAEIRMPDEPFTKIPKKVAKRWPALASAIWFPAIPDGYANHFGSGHADAQTAMVSASVMGALRLLVQGVPASIPGGLWCFRVDRKHCLVGGAISDVGRLVDWLDGVTPAPATGTRNQYLEGPIREVNPIVLPFLTGERATGWREDARAVVADISEKTDAAALYRGAMEGVAMSYRRVVDQVKQVAPDLARVVSGGGITSQLPAWLPILSSVIELPVIPLGMKRSTLRGNAVLALDQLAPDVERAEPELGAVIEPNAKWVGEYRKRFERFGALYDALYLR